MYNFSKALWRIAGFAYENGKDANWAIDEFRRFENWFYEKKGDWCDEEWGDRWFWATLEEDNYGGWLKWSYDDEDWRRRERARHFNLPMVGTHVEYTPDAEDDEDETDE